MTLSSLFLTLIIASAILVSAWGLGHFTITRGLKLAIAHPSEAVFFSATLGLGFFGWCMLLLGMAGLWYSLVAWILIGAGLLLGWVSYRAGQERGILPGLNQVSIWLKENQYWLFLGLLLVGVGSATWVLLTRALLPPLEWDEISYHLALIKLYVQHHRIIYVPFIVSSNWPLHVNMLYGLSLMMGSDIAPHLLVWAMSLLTALGLYLFSARQMNARFGVLVFALYLTIPLVKRLSGSGLIDVAIALFSYAVFFAFYNWYKNRHSSWLVLVGFFGGFAAATKLMGAAFPLLFGILWLWQQIKDDQPLKAAVKQGLFLVGCTALVVLPWYLRSYLFTGNPVWPFFFETLGGRNWDLIGDANHTRMLMSAWSLDLPATVWGVFLSFWYVFSDPIRLGGYAGGIGQLVLGLAALSTILLVKAPDWIRIAYLVSVVFYLLWFAVVSHQVRYLTPIMPYLCLLAGFTLFWFWQRLRSKALRHLVPGLVLVILLLDFPFFEKQQRELFLRNWPYLSGAVSREEFLESHIDVLPAMAFINDDLDSEAYVLLLPFETRTYYLDKPYYWGHPISQRVIRFEEYSTHEELANELMAMGFTHVLDSPTWQYEAFDQWPHFHSVIVALKDECGRPVFQDGQTVVYELTHCEPSERDVN